jgi:hypothetical protein
VAVGRIDCKVQELYQLGGDHGSSGERQMWFGLFSPPLVEASGEKWMDVVLRNCHW